jgi:hypothetical protein
LESGDKPAAIGKQTRRKNKSEPGS